MGVRPNDFSDDEFIAAWESNHFSPHATAKHLGLDIRGVYKRRANLANKGVILKTNPQSNGNGSKFGW